jgi:hypothetical protein
MENEFFSKPILNSPYEYPSRHWELDDKGQPTQQIIEQRRRAEFITPIPKPKKRKGSGVQQQLFDFEENDRISSADQRYDPTPIINELRRNVDAWRKLPHTNDWLVTPDTARLLQHWRHHPFNGVRPFFCQIEAVETAIWLTEVAPKMGKMGSKYLTYLTAANQNANPELMRLALKLATGAGKTTVMAMIIAWQTVNAVRRPNSKNFSRGFTAAITRSLVGSRLIKGVLDPYNPVSSTAHVNFNTSKTERWETNARHCHNFYSTQDHSSPIEVGRPSYMDSFFEDEQKQHDALLANIKAHLPEIEQLLRDFKVEEEDGVYRFYHQSFKTFHLQPLIRQARDLFAQLSPDSAPLNAWFCDICEAALDHTFDSGRTNSNWQAETRPILEAFWHCKYFLEQMREYGRELEVAPHMLPYGWAAILCLYDLR